ncbi:MAG: ABC transporter permease [Bacteroidales bacterium]|nr:ABC transporter permease [Bacteroidales bacterium]MCF8405126.1 ABC transporter permease [Bacteroidales bacterium]
MFWTNLILAFRILKKQIGHTIINILGLSIGMASTLLILFFVWNELSFDNFHKGKEKMFRGVEVFNNAGQKMTFSGMYGPVGPAALAEIPEIESMVRYSYPMEVDFSTADVKFLHGEIHYADAEFFEFFSFELLRGNPNKVLLNPNSIVLSEEFAGKLFQDEDPIGKTIQISGSRAYTYVVTGIVAPLPPNSSLEFQALASLNSLKSFPDITWAWDGGITFQTFFRLIDASHKEIVETKLTGLFDKYINEKLSQAEVSLGGELQNIEDMHLGSENLNDSGAGDKGIIYFFSLVAVFILLIAIINFTNLSTAIAMKRSREVGLKKVVGAGRAHLIRQFLGESLLISFVAIVVSLLIIELTLPLFNRFLQSGFSLSFESLLRMFPLLIVLWLIVGVGAGSYPAFYLSMFQPQTVIKGSAGGIKSRYYFRNGLVLVQFVITSGLIISTLVIASQLKYMRSKDLGYNPENLVTVHLNSPKLQDDALSLKQEILNLAGVSKVSASSDFPGYDFTSNGYFPEGEKQLKIYKLLEVDADYLSTMEIGINKGRNFFNGSIPDEDKYIVNQSLANSLGWNDAIGKVIRRDGEHKIIGVINDFHFAPLHEKVAPLIITIKANNKLNYNCLTIRMHKGAEITTLKEVENIISASDPSERFDYTLLDRQFNSIYQTEQKFISLFSVFTILAILIAALGLFGLVAFIVQQRTKEIGIRKVLGASNLSVVNTLSKNYLVLVIISTFISFPLGWMLMNEWLQGFAFRVHIGFRIFAETLVITFLISAIAILFQTLAASRAKPVESLKYE